MTLLLILSRTPALNPALNAATVALDSGLNAAVRVTDLEIGARIFVQTLYRNVST